MSSEKICFVIMGFGKKTDYESGRTLDLDATYEAIIKPAVLDQNLRCIRADEIIHSGIIDSKMYDMLYRADLVIADISTGNVNAVYELGVRHGIRPHATIVMKEKDGKVYFDLNHINIFSYTHLGEDIGSREATRAKGELSKLIKEVMGKPGPDSPLYSFIPGLASPTMTNIEFDKFIDATESAQDQISQLLKEGDKLMRESNPRDAEQAYLNAIALKPDDHYILQKLALSTYKSKSPNEYDSLIRALKVVEKLDTKSSNDPESLGIAGAIYKRLFLLKKDLDSLNSAIQSYGRGFELCRDYYNGENLALCFDLRSYTQTNQDEFLFDKMSAKKVRLSLVGILEGILKSANFDDRSDKKWVYATMSNCAYALQDIERGSLYEKKFKDQLPSKWEIETFEANKNAVYPLIVTVLS